MGNFDDRLEFGIHDKLVVVTSDEVDLRLHYTTIWATIGYIGSCINYSYCTTFPCAPRLIAHDARRLLTFSFIGRLVTLAHS
jgi:hypothetical protein